MIRKKKKPTTPALPRLRKGTIGTMGEYLKNVAEYSRFVNNNKRKGQLTDEQLVAAGINGGMIRFSVGLENVGDIIADIEKGLNAAE